MVAQFNEDGVDGTADYEGYDFNFGMEGELTVSTNMDPLTTGLWRVVRDSEGGLKVYLNLGDDEDVFSDLTDVWDLVSIDANRIELKDVSDDGSMDILVFEK